MFFAIILTANHFILDAVAGAVVSFIGFGFALLFERYREPLFGAVRARLAGGPPVSSATGRAEG
jgi:peptidoglycan biosynthesis protein MviN/MurJ (putative lipid II flippase)